MLPPLFAVLGGVAMVYLAVGEPEALVVDDYARIEEITRERFARDRRAAELGLSAAVTFSERADGRTAIAVELAGAGDSAPRQLSLRLRHAAHAAADRAVLLERAAGGYVGTTDLAAGRYALELTGADADWRLAGSALAGTGTVALTAGTQDGAP
jgi:hypothetical protein